MIEVNSTLTSILGRNNQAQPAIGPGTSEVSIHTDFSSAYFTALPGIGFVIIGIILLLICVKRNRAVQRQEPEIHSPSPHEGTVEQDYYNNYAFERTTAPQSLQEAHNFPGNIANDEASLSNSRFLKSDKTQKVRPIGMATRIQHGLEDDSTVRTHKKTLLPTQINLDKSHAELIKSIKNYQIGMQTTSEANETDVTGNTGLKRVVKESPTFHRLKYGSTRSGRNSPSNLLGTGVRRKCQTLDYKSSVGQLDDSSYDGPNFSAMAKRGIRDTESAVDSGSQRRKRTPRMSDAGTKWARENHLTRDKKRFSWRFRSLSRRSLSKKRSKHDIIDDLPAELMASTISLNPTHSTGYLQGGTHGSPYKLQVQSSVRTGNRILYRNGTRKRDRNILKKSKKRLANFETSVVEESPSFYMSFDTPMPPSTAHQETKSTTTTSIKQNLVEDSSAASDYEGTSGKGGYQKIL